VGCGPHGICLVLFDEVRLQRCRDLVDRFECLVDRPIPSKFINHAVMDKLLSVEQTAELLGTTSRFPRRLIAERRIRFVRVGRHVRITESAIEEYVAAATVEPTPRRARGVA
jgi:excisionase family DNA binding protein